MSSIKDFELAQRIHIATVTLQAEIVTLRNAAVLATELAEKAESRIAALSPERVLQLLACIEAAKRMRELGVEISRRCIEPPYMSEKAAINEFIGVFDGPLQRTLDAALAKLEQK